VNAPGSPVLDKSTGNFRYIYNNKVLRDQFFDFYANVFHLYPEDELHQLVYNLTQKYEKDDDIYMELQSALNNIKPFLSDFRYALPALAKQKKEMTEQTLQLLDSKKRYEGYMEIGTTGRYLSQLEDKLDIQGRRYLLHTTEAGYGPLDIIDRGQLLKIGEFIDMGHYSTNFSQTIEKNSLGLVTVYIGFHHCPLVKREQFISAVRDVIKPGGTLILRDHDAHNEDLWRIAALAHDTFNAGTKETLATNHNEVRNFYSFAFITDYLNKSGFHYEGKVLYQKGDPTRNGLMAFTKV
jgi:SAM-dependent methyltransferase